MIRKNLGIVAILAAAVLATGCVDEDDNVVSWDTDGLPALGEDLSYEAWILTDGGDSISLGQFDVDESGLLDRDSERISDQLRDRADRFLVTIEPQDDDLLDVDLVEDEDDDREPGDTVVLAGDFDTLDPDVDEDDIVRTADLSMAAALGADLTMDVGGRYFLGTPTSAEVEDFEQGIWFMETDGEPGLVLPELSDGWRWEAWLDTESGLVSLGTFDDAVGPDSDGAGPAAGDQAPYDFPGQDFIDPPMSLVGTTALVSLEPAPDSSTEPYLLMLEDLVEDLEPAVVQELENIAAPLPSGTVRIEDEDLFDDDDLFDDEDLL